ncbi:MAG: putative rane protein [Polaromonas sp.]|nr:putative rane protein [Polaromonas sp.]
MMDALMAFLHSLQGFQAYALLLALLIVSGFGLPINEDVLVLVAGALTLRGVMEPVPLMAVAWCGLVLADAMVFHWGHRFGPQLLRHRFCARLVSEARLLSMQGAMQRYGPAYIFVARFMPGFRTPLLLAAGSLRMPYRQLFVYDGAGAAVVVPLCVYSVRYVGGRWEDILALLHRFRGYALPAVALLVLGFWLYRWRRSKRAQRSG